MQTVYIVDIRSSNNRGKCTGHFIPVARNYADILADCCDVRVAAGPTYGNAFAEKQTLRLPYSIPTDEQFWIRLKSKIKSLLNCLHLFRKVSAGSCLIWQHSTLLTSCIGIILFGWMKCVRIHMIIYDASSLSSPLNRLIFRMASKRITRILCPNSSVGQACQLPYHVVPDYIYHEQSAVRSYIPFEKKNYDFCLVGRFNADKGIAEAIRALKHTSCRVIVAGSPDTAEYGQVIRDAAQGASHIELRLGYLDFEQYETIITESKYGILNYQQEYALRSSGVVYDILFRGVPVIGADCPALSMVKSYGTGELYDSPSNIDWDTLAHDKERHSRYLNSIEAYKITHREHIQTIRSLVMPEP